MSHKPYRSHNYVPPVPAVSVIPRMKNTINVYYNISYHNNSQDTVTAQYQELRDSPIVKKGSNYAMSVIYMDISLENIRIFDTGSKILTVTMTYPPDELISVQDLFPVDVDIFNFNDILVAIGDAFKAATDDIISQYDAIHGPGSWTGDATKAQLYPFVEYFSESRLFGFYNDSRNSTSGTGSGLTPILMYLSPELATLFKSIMIDNVTKQVMFPILPGNTNLATLSAPQVAGNYVKNVQNFESTELWYDVQNILLVSDKLGTRPEYIGSSLANLLPNGVGVTPGSNTQLSILASFNIRMDAGENNPSTRIVYYPTAEYRWIDIKADKPIQETDFKFYYSDREGRIFPVMLGPGDGFNIKCLFSIRTI